MKDAVQRNAKKKPTKPATAHGKLKPAKPHKPDKALVPHRPASAKGEMPPACIANLAPKKKRKQTI